MKPIQSIEGLRENQHLEVKEARDKIPDSIWETYSAFANTEGGWVVLGMKEIREGGEVAYEATGVRDANRLIDEFWITVRNPQRVNRDILPADSVMTSTIDGKDVVIIDVPKASRFQLPIEVYDKKTRQMTCYVRRGEADSRCTEEERTRMLSDASDVADGLVLDELGIDALSEKTIARYREIFDRVRSASPWVSESDPDFLYHVNALGLSRDGTLHPTKAGLLAFGQEHRIVSMYANYHLDYRNQTLPDVRWIDRLQSGSADWSGNLIDFYLDVAARLDRALPQPFGLADNGMRHTVTSSLNDAVHEAVANALVHAYYGHSSRLTVVLDPDQLVVANPGTFLVEREAAIAGGISDTRNPILAKLFMLIGVVDRAGSGLQTIYATWRDLFGTQPTIDLSYGPDEVRMVLPLDMPRFNAGSARRRRVSADEIVELCRVRVSIRVDDLIETFGMKRRSAQQALSRLVSTGRLVSERAGRAYSYKIPGSAGD